MIKLLKQKNKTLNTTHAFTLIEVLVIVFIIGLLATVILVLGIMMARDKAAIGSYRTTMNSLRTATEMCVGSGKTLITGVRDVGEPICNGTSESYPNLSEKCGEMQYQVSGGANNWSITTTNSCKGCTVICTVDECSGVGC